MTTTTTTTTTTKKAFAVVLLALFLSLCVADETGYHVCSAGDARFVGTYRPSREELDGATVHYNDKDMAIFRNNGFWYLGNLGPWPPETHYRCVWDVGCNYKQSTPPVGPDAKWTAAKTHGKEPAPTLSTQACTESSSPLATEEL